MSFTLRHPLCISKLTTNINSCQNYEFVTPLGTKNQDLVIYDTDSYIKYQISLIHP